jgi:hypothetical protein
LISLLKNRITKEKMVIFKMENEDEESESWEKLGGW